ncbi:serine/arginine repetitive matrix protein 1-like isoform X1 [Strigops habroptila]|uniref:serine/arginine repetitive matrix protein 1-like isoform X1 n=1 Tax=Strigops habroptila TaxID=2489341 RepID=UPI0011CF3907|nr:serine/arginine repetitive matrix protein 1-like isoform X1 [Strigops habroptila]
MAVLGSMLLGMVFCCVIHLWRKRRRRIAAASASQADISRRTSDMGSWIPRSNPSETWTQQPSPVPAKLPRQPRGRPPRPPPPQVPWLSNSASRVLQDQYSSLDYPETEEPPPRPQSQCPDQGSEAAPRGYRFGVHQKHPCLGGQRLPAHPALFACLYLFNKF